MPFERLIPLYWQHCSKKNSEKIRKQRAGSNSAYGTVIIMTVQSQQCGTGPVNAITTVTIPLGVGGGRRFNMLLERNLRTWATQSKPLSSRSARFAVQAQ